MVQAIIIGNNIMTPGVPGFNPSYSQATTATSNNEASGSSANASQGTSATNPTADKAKGAERLSMLKKQDDKQRKKVLKEFYGSGKADAALAQQSALKAAARQHGEPSSANAHAEYSVTGAKYSEHRLSNSEPGKHFLNRLEKLETLFKGSSRPAKEEIRRICEGITDCAEIFAGKLGMTLQDVSEDVLKENNLEGKDPASFKLTDDEYNAVCQKVQSLHKEGVGYWEAIEAAYFAPPY
jgi:hypothetical protein